MIGRFAVMFAFRRFAPWLALGLALGALALSASARAMGAPASTTSAAGTTTYVPSDSTGAHGAAPNPGATGVTAVGAPSPTATTPAGGVIGRGARPATGSATRARADTTHISAVAIVIAALGAALALACAAWAVARRRAFEPHWWLSARHSVDEARYRTSATWAEFTDWARLGH